MEARSETFPYDIFEKAEASFSEMLSKFMTLKGKTSAEVYNNANIDRRLFSKIHLDKNYKPRKTTVLALAIGLKLSLQETQTLLERAGYAFSHALKFDIIVEYFIAKKIYDIYKINEVLLDYNQPLLGD